eukprot:CAMPEP_0175734352 /NCGR_PEP_ID=MMETSP0097-20121207/52351_1 /TAXON_ID=311494 /ORGANISM="Alexandrium monilatum, Strain CCMP3105" /LENGTH=245 /DNA_ID=CAMNT_0017042395 /DNA_START=72 /DNA_END=807 /DNA_ORIENTATION=-
MPTSKTPFPGNVAAKREWGGTPQELPRKEAGKHAGRPRACISSPPKAPVSQGSDEVRIGVRVVDRELVGIRLKVLLERRQCAEPVVERLAQRELLLLEHVRPPLPLGQHLPLVQHLPDVEVRGARRLPDEVVGAGLLQALLELRKDLRLVELLLDLLIELLLASAHSLERVAETDERVADVIDLAQELLVHQAGLVPASAEAKLVAQVAEACIGLADAIVAALNVRKVRQHIFLQDLRLVLLEPL